MNFNKLLLTGAAVGVATLSGLQVANATDAVGTASAIIRAAITLTQDQAMNFGEITPDAAGDTVSLDTSGNATSTGSSDLGGTTAAGGFTATGTASSAVTIAFSSGDTLTGPGTAMPLGNFVHDAGGSPAFDGSGDLDFDVGADLTINASQAAGNYSGTYTVSVNYQ